MRKRSLLGLVLGAVILPLSYAQAATEVTRLPANNASANAFYGDEAGNSIGIFVTRSKGGKGGPVDRLFYIVFMSDGTGVMGSGVLPAGAFHVEAKSAWLEVDVNDIAYDFLLGSIPANPMLSVDWAATDQTHLAGNNKLDFGNTHVLFVGNRTTTVSDVTATVFGAALSDPVGDMASL